MKHEKKSQIQTDRNLMKLWPNSFIKEIPISAESALAVIEIKKTLPQALVE